METIGIGHEAFKVLSWVIELKWGCWLSEKGVSPGFTGDLAGFVLFTA